MNLKVVQIVCYQSKKAILLDGYKFDYQVVLPGLEPGLF